MERKIKAMKKERNKQRAETQRRNPTAKRRRLDEAKNYKEVRDVFKTVMSEENSKRKAEESVLEKQPNVKRKKTDIRDYLSPNTDEASRAEHQSSTATEKERCKTDDQAE